MSRKSLERFESRLAVIAQTIGMANVAGRGGNQEAVNQVVDFLLDGKPMNPTRPIPQAGRSPQLDRRDESYYLLWEGIPISRPESAPLKVYANDELAESLSLTSRQLEAVACLVTYDTDIKYVAKRLIISPHTAKNILVASYDKLGVRSQALAAVTTIRTGLLRVTEANK